VRQEAWVYANIVVGTDLSETAAKAVDQAAALAKAFGAKLHIVTGFKSAMASNLPASTLEAMAYGVAAELLHEAESKIGDEVRSTLDRLAKRYESDGISVQTYGCGAEPADALLEIAENTNADLIVVGNRRMQGVQRVLGAVANDVAHHAPCDVFVVKTV
jgi:nucleotide-binding universal stress UspA family protein